MNEERRRRIQECKKRYYERYREKILDYNKKYYEENKERILEDRKVKYRSSNTIRKYRKCFSCGMKCRGYQCRSCTMKKTRVRIGRWKGVDK